MIIQKREIQSDVFCILIKDAYLVLEYHTIMKNIICNTKDLVGIK
jgi:hypothetical protein